MMNCLKDVPSCHLLCTLELSSNEHDFWLGAGCLAYNTFHVV